MQSVEEKKLRAESKKPENKTAATMMTSEVELSRSQASMEQPPIWSPPSPPLQPRKRYAQPLNYEEQPRQQYEQLFIPVSTLTSPISEARKQRPPNDLPQPPVNPEPEAEPMEEPPILPERQNKVFRIRQQVEQGTGTFFSIKIKHIVNFEQHNLSS
jgi:hypothetical protein